MLARWYADGQLPDDEKLYRDVEQFAGFLRQIYEADRLGRAPRSLPPEVIAVERAAAGPEKRTSTQGFGLTAAERSVIERHAMAMAKQHLRQKRWQVQDVSAERSYDFLCRHQGEEIIVEVKGTTSAGSQILLTRNEVQAHRRHHPHNALVVVHSIELIREASGPTASGGELLMVSPWLIEDDQLTPIAYQCRLPA
ncbi:protein NO VEIN domain-containing protein [Siccirubricoccus deserti]